MITIREVSELAQVSQATVSRIINGHPTVKEKNKIKVMEAIEKLGYKPNALAQALASNRSNSVGMLVGSLAGTFYGPLMHFTELSIRENHFHLLVVSGRESKSIEAESIRFLQSKQVDGLIIHSDALSDEELIKVAQETPAIIILNRNIPELQSHCITVDNEFGGYLATKYLLEMGHTKVGCITGQMSKIESRERLQGYRNALSEFRIPYNAGCVIEARFDYEMVHDAARRLLDRNTGITAIFCQNDVIASAVYDVCTERNLSVGEDISLVGFDNDIYSHCLRPLLTTINFPIVEMANEASRAVIGLINKNPTAIKNTLNPELIIRDSVKKLN
jgi:LacI family transcriptional regulator